MSLPRFVSIGGPSTGGLPVGLTRARGDFDLLTFLEAVQRFDVDLLPMVWRPQLEIIGLGGTSLINQSLINLQTSFAFKRRYSPFKDVSYGNEQDDSIFYQALTAEIMVLGRDALRGHPNIVNLAGVCWDPTPGNGVVWPVLVARKSHHGDLLQFSKSTACKKLSVIEKFQLCRDIGSAIAAVHASGVIHVFKDANGGIQFRVTDFGYSTAFADSGDGEGIQIAISRPWTAPEHWQGREYTIVEAKSTDLYSYGLLCLWFLFSGVIMEATLSHPNRGYVSFDTFDDDNNMIEDWKAEARMEDLACKLIDLNLSLDMAQRQEMKLFFRASLSTTAANRQNLVATALPTVEFPDPRFSNSTMYQPTILPVNQGFQISRYIVQLLKSDYRVRPCLLNCLRERAVQHPNTESGKNAAFQCAISYTVGLGAPKDGEEALKWLNLSSRSSSDMSEEMQHLRTLSHSKLRETSEEIETLIADGFNAEMEYRAQFREGTNLRHVEACYRREIGDMQAVFGDDHDLVRVLERALVLILEELNEFTNAESLRRQHLSMIQMRQGDKHRNTLTSIDNLATNLTKQGRYTEAEELTLQVLAHKQNSLGDDHLHTLVSMNNLASLLSKAGKYPEATRMHRRVLSGRTKLLGPDHPETLASADFLASALHARGRYKDAESMARDILSKKRDLLGADHPDTLSSMGNLAAYLNAMGLYEESLDLCQQVLAKDIEVFGETHSQTMTAMANLAETLLTTGDLASAALICQRALDANVKVFGPDHSSTARAKMKLAQTLVAQGKYNDAQAVVGDPNEEGVNKVERTLPDQIVMSSVQATIFSFQGKHREATEFHQRVLEATEELYGESHNESLSAKYDLAASLMQSDNMEAAAKMSNAAWNGMRELLGPDHPSTLKSAGLVGNVLQCKGQIQNALDVMRPALRGMQDVWGDRHIETLKLATETAAVENSMGQYAAAEELYRKSLTGFSDYESLHPYALSCKHGLGKSLSFQGRYAEAEDVLRQVLSQRQETFGDDHPDTTHTFRELAITMGKQGRHVAAEPILRKVASFSSKNWGERHSFTLEAEGALAEVLRTMNQHPEAENILHRILRMREMIYGLEHPATLNTVNSLASVFQSQAKNELAISMYRRVVDACQNQATSGDMSNRPLENAASCNLGNLLREMGNYAEAEGPLLQAMKGFQDIFGEAHRNTTLCMRSLLSVYRAMGKEVEAQEIFMTIGGIYDRHNLWEEAA